MIQVKFHAHKSLSRKTIYLTLIFAVVALAVTIVHSSGNSTGPTKLLSVNLTGTSSGNNGSDVFGISANGRYVLFESVASDLVTNDTNGATKDVFVRDLQTNTTTLVSVNYTGTGSGNSQSQTPSISQDGRYVVFVSAATDLVPVNPGSSTNVYLRDLQMGTTRLVSVAALTGLGASSNGALPVVSANGRYVAFQTRAANLGPPDSSDIDDIYVRDMQLNTTQLASINTAGTGGGNAVSGPIEPLARNGFSISSDGRYVVFQSQASNLTLLPDNDFGTWDVYVRDLQAGTTTCASLNSAGTSSGNASSYNINITPDGRYVVFVSLASDLTTNDLNGHIGDVFLRDLQTGATTLVSVNSAGESANYQSPSNYQPVVVSADGRYVAFQSGANNLVANDNNGFDDVFVHDVQTGVTRLVSFNSAGTASANSVSNRPVISADGRFVAFISFATDLTTTPDSNSLQDIYVRDMRTGHTVLVSINPSGTASGNNESTKLAISASGHYLALTSYASNLTTTTDLNNSGDVFLFYNRAKGGAPADFDGDGKTDLSVFRPANGSWYISQSSNGGFRAQQFGVSTDRLVPGDYDNDGKADIAVFRNGDWFVLQSSNSSVLNRHFGSGGDIPVPADYDNDGKTDFAAFRPTTGIGYIERSSDSLLIVQAFGQNGDLPVPGDYDGDGDADIAVWRPSSGTWFTLLNSGTRFSATQFGLGGDKPVQADYDGDGRTDVAVYRPSTGTWYQLQGTDGFRSEQFGLATDVAVPADYDGDGQTDIAVFRDGVWYIKASTGSARPSVMLAVDLTRNWGLAGDKPVPASYVPLQ